MARPRVFISSTYYDLKHVRASLSLFVESLGFDSVLSEKGDIAYSHDRPLDESCYREAESADIFVLLVGGRYGSEVSSHEKKVSLTFFDRYESITKKEYESAMHKDIPIYIMVEKGVYSEYQTYLRNKANKNINYAHVDSVNVFILLEEILDRPRNNPVQTFEKLDEIQIWLREQWSGLFRELLRRQSQQQQLNGLTLQISELKEVNSTLKTYLEAVLSGADKEENTRLIATEEQRLEEVRRQEQLRKNRFTGYIEEQEKVPFEIYYKALLESSSVENFLDNISKSIDFSTISSIAKVIEISSAQVDLNRARLIVGKIPFAPVEKDFFVEHLIKINDKKMTRKIIINDGDKKNSSKREVRKKG